jgi:hypothetical protein
MEVMSYVFQIELCCVHCRNSAVPWEGYSVRLSVSCTQIPKSGAPCWSLNYEWRLLSIRTKVLATTDNL